MNLKKVLRIWAFVAIPLVAGYFLATRAVPYVATDVKLDHAMNKVVVLNNPAPRMVMLETDYWGRPLIFTYESSPTFAIWRVKSMGRDGIEGTADDMVKAQYCYRNQ